MALARQLPGRVQVEQKGAAVVFSRFFRPDPRRQQMDDLHTRVVAASRVPALYLDANVPDTVEGRFECMSLHAILLLRRLRMLGEQGDAIAQEYVDCFFRHLDIALRELGVGDLSVGKRIKKLAKSFYARVAAYDAALATCAADDAALKAELARNVLGGEEDATRLAAYVRVAIAHLDTLDLAGITGGEALFPPVEQRASNAGGPHATA